MGSHVDTESHKVTVSKVSSRRENDSKNKQLGIFLGCASQWGRTAAACWAAGGASSNTLLDNCNPGNPFVLRHPSALLINILCCIFGLGKQRISPLISFSGFSRIFYLDL